MIPRRAAVVLSGWTIGTLSAVPVAACALLFARLALPAESAPSPGGPLPVRISWGHRAANSVPLRLKLSGSGLTIARREGWSLEAEDSLGEDAANSRAGGGDVDGLDCVLEFPPAELRGVEDLNSMWRDLIALSDPDTARRLRADPSLRRDDRRLTVGIDRVPVDAGLSERTRADGSVERGAAAPRGFTLTADQLHTARSFWIPSLDVYVAAGEQPVPYEEHLAALAPRAGSRVLDEVRAGGEATLDEYTSRWADMGDPSYRHPSQPEPGHILCIAWDSALHKFGIDRGAGVRNDLGSPDRFQLGFDFGALDAELVRTWRGQRLTDGLPVVATRIERDGVRYEIEQFAYPLDGPHSERRGDVPMALVQSLRLTNLSDRPLGACFRLTHQRQLAEHASLQLHRAGEHTFVCEDANSGVVALALQGQDPSVRVEAAGTPAGQPGAAGSTLATIELIASVELPARGSRELVIKLPSPVVPPAARDQLLEIDFPAARAATLRFWEDRLAEGAQFLVPEPAVNELFRANLWHAMRLPRRHGGLSNGVRIDLPYSNFAYGQQGVPWPVNHAVYVDSMLYDLRGHHRRSVEELSVMYRDNQEPDGRIRGYANWVVYTPGMVYAAARHLLLSGDQGSWERLLPPTLKAADWCLAQTDGPKDAGGLVFGPLNDLSGDGVWAFSQAYVYAALDLLAVALDRVGHPRAGEFRRAAVRFRGCLEREFAAASVRSPLVQLRDHTWSPYVPCEARSSGRRLDQWYPTDVDTGALHLPRLRALDADGSLTDWLLHDHEDNLFLHGWGMANEPVYNQQATVYLLRDEPLPAIRAFYSCMACAFSHGQREPVEHRWTWGQYFGPPSTDGAWFELYRNMLIQERDGDQLLLLGATPRKWLADGQRIEVRGAPTYFGPLSMAVQSLAIAGTIRARIQVPQRARPRELVVRLRHPTGERMETITVNGKQWTSFEPEREQVRIADPHESIYEIVAHYREQ